MNDLTKMISSYKGNSKSMTERQKAELESQLWASYTASSGKSSNGSSREWLVTVLGGKSRDYELRFTLWNAGEWVQPLWDLLENGMPRTTAVRLMREARSNASLNRVSLAVSLQAVLAAYNESGYEARTPEGKTYRRTSPGQKSQQETESESNPIFDSDQFQITRSKKFRDKLVALTSEYVRTSLTDYPNIDVIEARRAVDDFTSFVREACEDLRRKISVMRSEGRKDSKRQKVTRDQLRHACEVLGISVIYGHVPDLRVAKRAMLKRARELHPDRHGGSEKTRAEYQAVIESYGVIETYEKGLTVHANGDRSNEVR